MIIINIIKDFFDILHPHVKQDLDQNLKAQECPFLTCICIYLSSLKTLFMW